MAERIRKDEWITVKSGHSFFNGYYDNLGNRVEGDHKNGVRMTLTGQVFPIMSGVATNDQVKEIYKSAKKRRAEIMRLADTTPIPGTRRRVAVARTD